VVDIATARWRDLQECQGMPGSLAGHMKKRKLSFGIQALRFKLVQGHFKRTQLPNADCSHDLIKIKEVFGPFRPCTEHCSAFEAK
jgi:hypothetical protein